MWNNYIGIRIIITGNRLPSNGVYSEKPHHFFFETFFSVLKTWERNSNILSNRKFTATHSENTACYISEMVGLISFREREEKRKKYFSGKCFLLEYGSKHRPWSHYATTVRKNTKWGATFWWWLFSPAIVIVPYWYTPGFSKNESTCLVWKNLKAIVSTTLIRILKGEMLSRDKQQLSNKDHWLENARTSATWRKLVSAVNGWCLGTIIVFRLFKPFHVRQKKSKSVFFDC